MNNSRAISSIGIFLIAIGTGGIKPCVVALGADQFKVRCTLYTVHCTVKSIFWQYDTALNVVFLFFSCSTLIVLFLFLLSLVKYIIKPAFFTLTSDKEISDHSIKNIKDKK